MTNDPNLRDSAIVEVSDETKALVESEMPNETEQVKNETMALVEALRREAQSEVQKAGEYSREKYLEAVRTARAELERMNLFDPERIEQSIQMMQNEAERDWDKLITEVANFGDRLADAAKAAWEALTAPRPNDPR